MGTGVGTGFGGGFGVGTGVGTGVGGGGVTTAVTVTEGGVTEARAVVFWPPSTPLLAMNEYACVPTGSCRARVKVTPASYVVPLPFIG